MTEVINRIHDIEGFLQANPCPEINGVYEGHIFFSCLNPSKELIEAYTKATDQINEFRVQSAPSPTTASKIKACVLALNFRGVGYVVVLQSARYFHADNLRQAIAELQRDADEYTEYFTKRNIDIQVFREKLECLASCSGVPKTDQEAKKFSKYFEFHIRIRRKNDNVIDPVSDEELKELEEISERLSAEFNCPVPLSYNKAKESEFQRYLNVRFRGVGSDQCKENVDAVVQAIEASKNFKWEKTISEYVPFDTLTALDKGWIDFE